MSPFKQFHSTDIAPRRIVQPQPPAPHPPRAPHPTPPHLRPDSIMCNPPATSVLYSEHPPHSVVTRHQNTPSVFACLRWKRTYRGLHLPSTQLPPTSYLSWTSMSPRKRRRQSKEAIFVCLPTPTSTPLPPNSRGLVCPQGNVDGSAKRRSSCVQLHHHHPPTNSRGLGCPLSNVGG